MLFRSRKKGRDALTAVTFADDGIALARIRRTHGGPELLSCEFHPHDGDAGRALRDAVGGTGANGSRCTTLMDSDDYQLLLVEAPDVEPSELRAAIRWRIKDLIDFHVDDAVVDVIEIPGQERGRARMMYAVAARAGKVRERIDLVEDASLDLTAIDIEELALRNVAALLPATARGACTVWFGADYGVILITRGADLYLTRRVETGVSQLFAAAQHGDPDHGDFGAPLSALLDQVVLEVQRSLDYYDSHFSQPPVQAVYVAPTAPHMPFIAKYLAENLNVAAVELDLQSLFPGAPLPDIGAQARCLTAVGAALRDEAVAL